MDGASHRWWESFSDSLNDMKELLKKHKTFLISTATFLLGLLLMFLFQQKRIETLRYGESSLLNNCLKQTSIEGSIIDLDSQVLKTASPKRQSFLQQMDENTKALDPILKWINKNGFWMP